MKRLTRDKQQDLIVDNDDDAEGDFGRRGGDDDVISVPKSIVCYPFVGLC